MGTIRHLNPKPASASPASLDDLRLACDAVHGIGQALQSVDAQTAARLGAALALIAGTLKEVQDAA